MKNFVGKVHVNKYKKQISNFSIIEQLFDSKIIHTTSKKNKTMKLSKLNLNKDKKEVCFEVKHKSRFINTYKYNKPKTIKKNYLFWERNSLFSKGKNKNKTEIKSKIEQNQLDILINESDGNEGIEKKKVLNTQDYQPGKIWNNKGSIILTQKDLDSKKNNEKLYFDEKVLVGGV